MEPKVNVTVRDARPEDASAIAELLAQLGYRTSEERVARRLGRLTSDAASRVLAAVLGTEVAGLAGTHVIHPSSTTSPRA